MSTDSNKPAVQTTGHAWDGDLQEYNNPLPRWWVWTFYATVVFAVVYWILYPSWPVGKSFLGGVKEITFQTRDGKEVTTHWNMRARYLKDIQSGEEAVKQREWLEKIANSSFEEILSDPDKLAFVRSAGKVMFADNCAACHGSGGQGKIGLFPNLVDDAWLWGGTLEDIHTTISKGRHGFMPAFPQFAENDKVDAIADYVLSLSGEQGGDSASIKKGEAIFQGEEGGCYYCHTRQATGMKSVGSANLTDKIWEIANVPGAATYEEKRAEVRKVILGGISRTMPTWKGRLPDETIKILTVYVHELGGGK
ncbi:MAG: cytochrome-c oxidase, cbb3-type subunit III [Gammaproteobacteria bacterium]|nr:MAG: cytochrome-c oxidase, cbb3-type subunit III [Gammaproteobacteria bacterium]